LPKHEQADRVWQELFVRRLPLSSATRDIVTILNTFGLPVDGIFSQELDQFVADMGVRVLRMPPRAPQDSEAY
jgi:hypothetical protein